MLKWKKLLRSIIWDACIRQQSNQWAAAILEFQRKELPKDDTDLDQWLAFSGPLASEIRRLGYPLSGQHAASLIFVCDFLKKVPGARREDAVLHDFRERMMNAGNCVHLKEPWVRKLKKIVKFWLAEGPDGFEDEVRHGPGATAEKALWDDKYHALRYRSLRIEGLWKRIDPLGRLTHVKLADIPSRVLVVEKDRKGGRIIAAEQATQQFVQQGLGRVMKSRLERFARLTCLGDREKHIQFLKDRINDRTTVDLSSASDFVTMPLAAAIFPRGWMQSMSAARSPKLSISDDVLKTKTLALMGNGFCFTALTTVCAALCALVTGDWVAGKSWSVFGDDIVIDDRYYQQLQYVLVCAGLVVNYDKTYRPEHPFAETCGTDLWRSDLTNVRPKFLRASVGVMVTVKDLPKLCEFQRYLATRRFDEAASYMAKVICDAGIVLLGQYPVKQMWTCTSNLIYSIGVLDHDDLFSRSKWSKRCDCLRIKDLKLVSPRRRSSLDAGESWAKATFAGSAVEHETLTRTGQWRLVDTSVTFS